jgi:hypothetical protein
MTDSTLSTLTAAATLDGTELHYVVQGGADRKATGTQIATYALGTSQALSSMAVTWTSSGTVYTGLGLAITDTGSAASSYIFNFQKGGSPFFAMRKDGALQFGGSYLALSIPDNTATNGNDRGVGAADLQQSRSSASQVASGTAAFLAGSGNTASGDYAVAWGLSSAASGHYSTAWNGGTASGQWSVCISVSGTASATMGFVGGHGATDRGVSFTRAWGGDFFTAVGQNQESTYSLSAITTDATVTKITTDRAAASASNQVVLPNNSTYFFDAKIAARRTDVAGEGAAFRIVGCITRDANAASTALIGSPTVTVIGRTDAAWTVVAAADTTNGCLSISVTGEAAKTVRWVGFVNTSEVGN